MKTVLKAELLRYVAHRQQKGFTLLELMIVLVISGLLAVIALPTFLNQANKAKQVEAKMFISTINRAQQVYIMEHLQFSDEANRLGISIYNSPHYRYSISLPTDGSPYVVHYAESLSQSLKPYVGMAAMVQENSSELRAETVLCESKKARQGKATRPDFNVASIACHSSTQPPE